MVWDFPLALLSGGNYVFTLSQDTYIGDLFAYLNSPTQPVDVRITANGCDVGDIIINSNFAAGSTFQFTAVNSARFIGSGGDGGEGGADNGGSGTPGSKGSNGRHAIQSDGFAVNIDIDDGFLLGGGGGGGGGSYNNLTATTGTAGGGGGGGQGWGVSTGGSAGLNDATAIDGNDGTSTNPGGGGAGGTSGTNDGGGGGDFGYAGQIGQFADPATFLNGSNKDGNGGTGGDGGSAFYGFNGAAATFNGSTSQSTLETQGRIVGEVGGLLTLGGNFLRVYDIIDSGGFDFGWIFKSDRGIYRVESDTGVDGVLHNNWYFGTNTPAASGYEMRAVPGTESPVPNEWETDPGPTGNWFNLNTVNGLRWLTYAFENDDRAMGVVEIGRAGENRAVASRIISAGVSYVPQGGP